MGRHTDGPSTGRVKVLTPSTGVQRVARLDPRTDPRTPARPLRAPVTGRRGMGLPAKLALVVVLLVTVLGAGVLLGPAEALGKLPWAGAAPCTAETVDVVVAPELVSTVTQILKPVDGDIVDDQRHCVAVQVRGQEPQDTLASADLLPADRAPNLWVPDSVVWGQKATRWAPQTVGLLATTPVVVTTSKFAAQNLGWTQKDGDPTWKAVLRGKQSVAVPDFRTQTEGLEALIALWQSLGGGKKADEAVVAAVFAGDREEIPSVGDALANARSGSSTAPLVPVTEQAVAYNNAVNQRSNLVAIYPKEGSPLMEYPILRVGGQQLSAGRQAAVARVQEGLMSARSKELVRQAGFRGPDGRSAVGDGIDPLQTRKLEPPSASAVNGMVSRIEALARPSRILAVIDVSGSMRAPLDDGLTRISLAAAAARLGANLLPDSAYVGAWTFAGKVDGNRDWTERAALKKLGSSTKSGQSWRSHLLELTQNFESYLSGGGTGLYDTTLASFDYMHDHYDPKAVNAIILLSDGANADSGSASLGKVVSEIKKRNKGTEKVAIYTAGLGPDADYGALKAIAEASGGNWYRIDTAAEGQEALLDGLRRSRELAKIGS
ncbi:VWA domain-containing protein [Spongisporangium articulatum]|uniref:VWA domain-containing protein n=1 Tax=Spongisporangium articulatum TaxID=3362603 RepID=A0ABW8ASX6_9ACTN